MVALLHNFTVIHHVNAVTVPNRGEAMGDRDRRSIPSNHLQGFLNRRFGFVVYG